MTAGRVFDQMIRLTKPLALKDVHPHPSKNGIQGAKNCTRQIAHTDACQRKRQRTVLNGLAGIHL